MNELQHGPNVSTMLRTFYPDVYLKARPLIHGSTVLFLWMNLDGFPVCEKKSLSWNTLWECEYKDSAAGVDEFGKMMFNVHDNPYIPNILPLISNCLFHKKLQKTWVVCLELILGI